MIIRVKEGKRGRWRWLLYGGPENDKFMGVSDVRGFDTENDALNAVKATFGEDIYLDAPGRLFVAHRRDWI